MTCIKKGSAGWKQSPDAKSADISVLEKIAHQLPAVPWADTWPLGHFSILGDVVGTYERGTDSAILTPQFQEKVSPQSQNSSCYSCIFSLSLKMSSILKRSQVIIITEFSLHVTVWEPGASERCVLRMTRNEEHWECTWKGRKAC